MGTTADFYVGCGQNAEWVGSIASDGSDHAYFKDDPIGSATTEEEYRKAVANLFAELQEGEYVTAEMERNLAWNSSTDTDYVYYFKDGKVHWDDRDDWPDIIVPEYL